MKIKEMPVDDRPREKMLTYGPEALSNSELLALVVGTGTRGRSALRLAEDVLSADPGGLSFLQGCSVEELSDISGVGPAKACRVAAALEIGKRLTMATARQRDFIRNTSDAAEYFMGRMRYYGREVFNILLLDAKGGVIGVETVSVGDMNSSPVHPRETFRLAVRRGAWGVIFAHNHPSGDPAPSREDLETTRRLQKAGEILGIHVLDHVIIGDGKYISLKAEGLL